MKPQPRYQPGDKIGGRYQVHRALVGGMGEVYLCLDLEENYPYALKTFQQRYLGDPKKLRATFEQEVATWVALEKHPNIVRCHWMDIIDNQPFLILEWIAGEEGKGADLRGWLRRGPLELRTALAFSIDMCRGLIHAHEKQPGIVHRDLKPENILVAQGRLAKITDFGLAQIVETASLEVTEAGGESEERQSMVGRGGIVGTPAYMAPEQWRGESLDERTDIYALGCILYEMLSGQPPYRVDFVPATPQEFQRWLSAMQAGHESGRSPVSPPNLPGELSELLGACLAKGRGQRPDSLADLLAQFEALYRGQFGIAPKTAPTLDQFTAINYNNRGATYANLRQHQAALADYGRAIELDANFAMAYSNRGVTYHELQQYEAALGDHNRAVELDHNLAPAYNNRGLTYHELQQYEAALGDYGRAIELDPNHALAYYNRGNTYAAALQQYPAALADYDRAIELNPKYAQAYVSRGTTYSRLQQYQEALADYGRAIELDPNFAMAYSNRGNTYAALQQYQAALADFNRAIELDPKYARAYNNRGLTYYELQQYQAALGDYGRAIELDPNDAQVYNNRGLTYHELQQYQAALGDYGRAIELDPTYAPAYTYRGNTYTALQQYQEALADHGRAIELDPNFAMAYASIGLLFAMQGNTDEALPYLDKAAQLGDPRAQQIVAKVSQMLGIEAEPHVDSAQQAFEAFQRARSVEAMQQAVAHFPFMVKAEFITAIEQAIAQQVPPEHRPAFEQRLTWLRQIASKH